MRTFISVQAVILLVMVLQESCISSESGAWAAAALLLDRVLSSCLMLTLFVLIAVQLF